MKNVSRCGKGFCMQISGSIQRYSDNGEVRDKTDYVNTIAHEFGYVLDVGDGYGDEEKRRPRADMLEEYDIMLDNHHKDAKVTNIDIHMMVMAASKKMAEFYGG